MFWMSSRQISQDIFCLSAEDGPVWSVEAYHSLRQKGPEEDVKEALCRFAAGVYNAALRENFRDIGCLRLNFFIKPDEADAACCILCGNSFRRSWAGILTFRFRRTCIW